MKNRIAQNLGLFIIILLVFACEAGTEEAKTDIKTANEATATVVDKVKQLQKPSFEIPYQLNAPDTIFKLVRDLKEISGLTMTSNEEQLLAVNDEQGIIFYLNYETGNAEESVKFAKMNDYEGIEAIGKSIYVTKSNGTIIQVKDIGSPLQVAESFPTFLKTANDVEGLGYDAERGDLLLACKGKAGEGEDLKKSRAIYSFNIKTKELNSLPFLVIKRAAIVNFLSTDKVQNTWAAYWKDFSIEQIAKGFSPSGIAIHPSTKNRYILSSAGANLLMVLNPGGEILQIEKIDPELLRQPEGICFHSDGRLFISSEGRGGKARLLVFSPNK